MIGLQWLHHSCEFPSSVEPEWSSLVERWYQLDGAALALTDTYWRHRSLLAQTPDTMILASPLGSNVTDAQFAATTAPSPAKFVHTLPNIRSASMLQVMNWAGEVFCLQNDPATLLTGLSEGMQLIQGPKGRVWVLSVTSEGRIFTGHIFVLSPESLYFTLKISKIAARALATPPAHDRDLFLWLNQSGQGAQGFQADDFEILNSRT